MTIRGCVLCLAGLLLPSLAIGQTSLVILDVSRVPSGVRVLECGSTSMQQCVIPRYRDGVNFPAGQLRGWGPASILTATDTTDDITPSDNRAIVITEGYGEDISEWQGGSSNAPEAAVLQPIIADVTVRGYSTAAYAANDVVNDNPAANDWGEADQYAGIKGLAVGGQINNVAVFYIPGTAIYISRPSSSRTGGMLWHDRLKWNVDRVSIRRAYAGLYNDAVDSHTTNIEVEACRDWGVRLGSSVHFANIHTYGCGNTNATGGGAGLFLDGDSNQGGPIYVENGPIGVNFDGLHNTVNGCFSHSCTVRNVEMLGQDSSLSQAWLKTAPVNIRISGDQCNISETRCEVADAGIGIDMNSAGNQSILSTRITGYKSAGDTHSENGIGIDIDATISQCVIEAKISYITKGIDFDGATITNDGSRIWITTEEVTTPVTWPSGQTWTTSVNAAETCDVRINGVRYYRP